MNANDENRMKTLLKQALPPVDGEHGPERDLWPAVLRRLDTQPAGLPWLDLALGGGLVALVALFPASIPVLLYYL
jgi:hypothetical protein